MASFHLAVKTIGRSAGRSATAAAAYRAGVEITDERTGLVHDYTRKQGVEHSALVVPADAPAWANDRAALWNAAEQAETRKNSTVAREYEIALPAELSAEARRELALGLAREISERHGVAVDVAIHAPGREGDQRNHHAHLLTTTRRIGRVVASSVLNALAAIGPEWMYPAWGAMMARGAGVAALPTSASISST